MKKDTIYDVYRTYGDEKIALTDTVLSKEHAIKYCLDKDYAYAPSKLNDNLIFPHVHLAEKEGNILAFYSSKNSKGKKDATGVFIPEAKAFVKANNSKKHGLIPIRCDRTTTQSRIDFIHQEIHQAALSTQVTTLAFFCHGWSRGNQFGFQKNNLKALTKTIKYRCTNDVKIVLYSCSNADGPAVNVWPFNVGHGADGGFADLLRDHLARAGLAHARVDAHKTRGHATWNPWVVRFSCASVEDMAKGGRGGYWLVDPKSEHWGQWRRRLADQKDTLRYRFPLMSQVEVLEELSR